MGTVILYTPNGNKEDHYGDIEIVDGRVKVVVEEIDLALNLPLAWCVIMWGKK